MNQENKLQQKLLWRVLTIISRISKNNPIGFFDSGVGGLTVLSEFRELLPNEYCIYFGDTKNMPYGEKSKEQLIDFSKQAFEFFESKKVKAVVMACNTTSAMVYDSLKDSYNFKLYPVIQSVTGILAKLPVKKIGVFATEATIKSHAYSKGINSLNPDIEVVEIACPEWVKIVEEHRELTSFAQIKVKMDEMLAYNPDKIVLGCTHYPYLLEQLCKFGNENLFINPAKNYVEFIKSDLKSLNMLADASNQGGEEFYVSESPVNFLKASEVFYQISTPVVQL